MKMMKIIIYELQDKSGKWEVVEKIFPYSEEIMKEFMRKPELISLEVFNS